MAERPRSPLSMVVLAMLFEAPMHAYRVAELIKQRGKDAIVNVAQRNSVYQTIERLEREGLIGIHSTAKQEGRPERVLYRLTKEGERTLHEWLAESLAIPAREFPQFPAALAFLMLLAPRDVLAKLELRVSALEERFAEEKAALGQVETSGLPRLFVIDDEYRHAMTRAELSWLKRLVDDLREKKLTWSEKWLREIAAKFG